MKQVFVLLSLIVIVCGKLPKDITDNIREVVMKAGIECVDELDASEDDVMPLIRHIIPETEKGRCFIACMHKKFNMMHKSGKVDKVSIFRMLEDLKSLDVETYRVLKPIADTCMVNAKNLENECETAASLLKCWWKEGNCGPTSDPSKKCAFDFEY